MRKAGVIAIAAVMMAGSAVAQETQPALDMGAVPDKNHCTFHSKGEQKVDLKDSKSFFFVVLSRAQEADDPMQDAMLQLDGNILKVALVAKVEDQSNPDKRTGSYTYNTADRDASVVALDIEQTGKEGAAINYAGKLTVAQKGKIRTFDIVGSCEP